MSRNREDPSHHSRRRPEHLIPTLPTTLRLIREHRRLSRVTAYARHGVSPSYLSQLESGKRLPSLETLEKITAGYDLNTMQARYLRELRAPAEHLETAEKLRQCVAENIELMTHIQDLERRGVLAAYVDPTWNVLACNDSFRAVLPGLEDHGDWIPVWLFSPAAQEMFIDWEREATHAVATTKVVVARYRESEQARELLRELRSNTAFKQLWSASIDIAYGRNTSDLLHLRDPHTSEPTSYSVTVSDVIQNQNIQLITALRKPYSGPKVP